MNNTQLRNSKFLVVNMNEIELPKFTIDISDEVLKNGCIQKLGSEESEPFVIYDMACKGKKKK